MAYNSVRLLYGVELPPIVRRIVLDFGDRHRFEGTSSGLASSVVFWAAITNKTVPDHWAFTGGVDHLGNVTSVSFYFLF